MKTFEKQPSDVLDYDIDMSEWFEDMVGDDIQSVTVTVTGTGVAPDLILGPDSHPQYQLIDSPSVSFKVWLGEGVNGKTYKVTSRVITGAGREKEVDFKIKVKDV